MITADFLKAHNIKEIVIKRNDDSCRTILVVDDQDNVAVLDCINSNLEDDDPSYKRADLAEVASALMGEEYATI